MITLKWLGHACFLITLVGGTKIVTDPFSSKDVGYRPLKVSANVVTISHEHFDHNKTAEVGGNPQLIRGTGTRKLKDVTLIGIETSHGGNRGKNTVFVYETSGIRICHLGDLGVVPTDDEVKKIGKVDVLLIPVGGTFTIDAKDAAEVVDLLKPKVVIPMHYRTPNCTIPGLAPVDDFLKGKAKVKRFRETNTVTIDPKKLPKETEIWVPSYLKAGDVPVLRERGPSPPQRFRSPQRPETF